MPRSAIPTPARSGGEAFVDPGHPNQRRYEALRSYLVEGASAAEVAARFGYSEQSVRALVKDWRAGRLELFAEGKPGPKRAPAKEAARPRVLELRRAGHSIDEIAAALADEGTPLNRTGIAELIAGAGLPRLPRRPAHARGAPRPARLPRAGRVDFADLPERIDSRMAGLWLLVPDLVALDLPGLVEAAGYPSTRDIPAIGYVLSLLALKATSTRRVSHAGDLARDAGVGLFAGLGCLPKATAATRYSYKLDHGTQQRFLSGLSQAMLACGLAHGADFDLDFHAIMHWGEDPILEKHYVPTRSQRARSVLTFFAQDGDTHNLIYANADISKAAQNHEVLAFCEHWRDHAGAWPAQLVFDQRLCTQTELAELDARGITFITLRMRTKQLVAAIDALPASAWKTVRLDRRGRYATPKVCDQPAVKLSRYPGTVRQLAVKGLGRDAPTIIITNGDHLTAKAVIERYARRMGIEQRLAEAIRAFHLDALSSTVALNVDLDVVLTVLADACFAALAQRIPGYADATPDTIQRRFIETAGSIHPGEDHITVRLDERAYAPVLRAADLPHTPIPWLGGRTLRFEVGKTGVGIPE
jgi:transposase-like protein